MGGLGRNVVWVGGPAGGPAGGGGTLGRNVVWVGVPAGGPAGGGGAGLLLPLGETGITGCLLGVLGGSGCLNACAAEGP